MPIQVGHMTLYTVPDLCEMLSVSPSTIRKYIREDRLSGKKVGRKWYVPDRSVRAYFADVGIETIPVPAAPVEIIRDAAVLADLTKDEPVVAVVRETPPVPQTPPPPEPVKEQTRIQKSSLSDDLKKKMESVENILDSLPAVKPPPELGADPDLDDIDVEQLLRRAERLKDEAKRVEEKFIPAEQHEEVD